MKKKKLAKTIKWILIGVGITALTLFTAVCVFFYFFLFGPPATTTSNIKNYEKMFENTNGLRTAYIVFPETIPDGTIQTDYYYYYRDTFNSATYEAYLQCEYDEDTYAKELARLKNTSKTYGGKKVYLKYAEKPQYPYPAYIANENAGSNYEYAMLTGTNEITYICTAFRNVNDVHFETKYLPRNYMAEEDRKFGSGFSIYYASVSSDLIDTHYTRDPVENIVDGHLRFIDDHMFCVNTKLNEHNQEIITKCSFIYVENVGEEGIEKQYHDIDGYQYIGLELNSERSHAIVTYLDGNQEKKFDIELPLKDK